MTKAKKEEKKEKKHEEKSHKEEKKDEKKEEKKEEKKDEKKVLTKEGDEKKDEKKEEEKKEKIIVPNFITRVKFSNQITVGKVTLSLFSNFNEVVGEGPTIIEAFPNGNSITNIITSSHIISHLKLQLVGEITSQEFPPLTVVQMGVPASGARLYANKHLVVISSEYSVKEASIQHDIVQLILKFAEDHKAAAILTIDALSGDPSEATSLLDQIQLSADQTGEEGQFGEEESGDYEDYADSYSYNIKSGSPIGSSDPNVDPITQLGKNAKKNNIKLTKDEEEKDSKKAPAKTITKTIPVPSSDNDKDKKKEEEEEKASIWFLTNEQKFGDFFKSLEYEPVVEVSLSGVQAGLVNQCRFVDTPVILLLARLDKLELGARPALLLIQTIDKFLKLTFAGCADIDISKLEESTNSLEAKLNELLKKLQPPKEETPNMLYM